MGSRTAHAAPGQTTIEPPITPQVKARARPKDVKKILKSAACGPPRGLAGHARGAAASPARAGPPAPRRAPGGVLPIAGTVLEGVDAGLPVEAAVAAD